MQHRRWTDKDFDSMSWHDCHVHAWRVVEGMHGSGELEFDIDYILEWKREQSEFLFVLVPARLTFHEVSDLRISLDWPKPSAALGPISLSGIERTFEKRAQYTATSWSLPVNWPSGAIDFEATGFTQHAWGKEVVSQRQVLQPAERMCSA
jgi:hypothetical protein